jgi:hypothetical protein
VPRLAGRRARLMPLFQGVRSNWVTVDPIRDGKRCPECLCTVHGRKARDAHRDYHNQQREWQSQVVAALRQICDKAGLSFAFAANSAPADPYEPDDLAEEDDEPEGIIIG